VRLTSQLWKACAHQLFVQVLGWVRLRHQGTVQPDEQSPVAMFTEAFVSCAKDKRYGMKNHKLLLLPNVISILSFLYHHGCTSVPPDSCHMERPELQGSLSSPLTILSSDNQHLDSTGPSCT
jgi:hypothetical protein